MRGVAAGASTVYCKREDIEKKDARLHCLFFIRKEIDRLHDECLLFPQMFSLPPAHLKDHLLRLLCPPFLLTLYYNSHLCLWFSHDIFASISI